MQAGILANKFLEVCGEWLEEHDWLRVRSKLGVFSSAAVVWLGIEQRLTNNSMRTALDEMVKEIQIMKYDYPFIDEKSKKLKKGKISTNTGGLSRARNRLTLESVEDLFTTATEAMTVNETETRKTYLLDGSNITIARTKDNLLGFCPTGNGKQEELHFPKIRVVGIHDLKTGIAKKINIGDWKTSEIQLANELLPKLEKGSLLIGDRFYSKPMFLKAAKESGMDVVVRLNDTIGKKLIKVSGSKNSESIVEWESKLASGEKVTISGKVIRYVSQVKGYRSSEFYFYTSDTSLSIEEVSKLYLSRVRVEVFIRDVKQTLKMFFIKSKTAENIKKEINLAYLTFNLVRSVMEDTAKATKIEPERLSFTNTISLCQAYDELFIMAMDEKETKRIIKNFRTHLLQCKLPNRKNKNRSYPRVVKNGKDRYELAGVVRKSNGVKIDEGK